MRLKPIQSWRKLHTLIVQQFEKGTFKEKFKLNTKFIYFQAENYHLMDTSKTHQKLTKSGWNRLENDKIWIKDGLACVQLSWKGACMYGWKRKKGRTQIERRLGTH